MAEVRRTINMQTITGACQTITNATMSILTISIWAVKSTIQMKMLYSAIRVADMTMTMAPQAMNSIKIKTIMEVYGHDDRAKMVQYTLIKNRNVYIILIFKHLYVDSCD